MLQRHGRRAVACLPASHETGKLFSLLDSRRSAAAAAAATSGQHVAAQDGAAAPSSTQQSAASSSSTSTSGGVFATPAWRPVATGGTVLKRHGRDLTQAAAEGRLDPLLGREDVLERALQVLLRRSKNNPVLIGDPGVGKTAVAEGIAQLIAGPRPPPGLAGRALISLDVGSLVAGTQYRGAFEERLTSLLNEVQQAAGRVLLFIDELHVLMDAGRVEGGMNAANLLKPALARGDLHCIGATTVEEYRKHIEADGAFARRFQPVMVEEPSPEEALSWLQGLRGRYEEHHGVRYTDAALETAVRAAQRYIPERRLPDSAIDVIDEAAARARLHAAAAAQAAVAAALAEAPVAGGTLDVVPPDSGEAARRLAEWQKAMAEAAAPAAVQQQQQQQQQPEGLAAAAVHALSCPHCGTAAMPQPGSATVTCRKCGYIYLSLPQDKLLLGASLFKQQLRQQQLRQQQQQQQQQQQGSGGQPPAAADVSPAEQAQAAAAAAAAAAQAAAMHAAAAAAPGPPLVDAPDVLSVVAEASGIPAEHLSQSAWQPLAELEARLAARVAGQAGAVGAAAGAVRLGRLGLQRGSRPLASLLLTGPAGVGKATLCRALAEELFGSDRHLLRFNLAEFSDRASVNRLVGAPPGFVGYGEGGLLTEAIRRRPHSVVLLERVDRAHPEVLSLVTQMLEAGELTDSMGKRCDLRNALLVLTTSPTSVPLPPAWGAAAPAAAGSGGSGEGAVSTVEVPEGHVHPEAYAGDAGGTTLSRHSAHSAAALSLPPEEGAAHPGVGVGGSGGAPQQRRRQEALHPLRLLPSELLSRLDAAVSMRQLGQAEMEQVVELQLGETRAALCQQGIDLAVDPAAVRWLAARGASPASGARRLAALLREQLLQPVAEALLAQRAAARQGQQQQPQGQPLAAAAGAAAVASVRVGAGGEHLEVSLS